MIKIVKSDKNLLEAEILDEDKHSIPNLLVKYLLKDDRVEYAGYRIPHPLVSYPRIVVRTREGYSPLEVLKSVIEKIINDVNNFEKAFLKALK